MSEIIRVEELRVIGFWPMQDGEREARAIVADLLATWDEAAFRASVGGLGDMMVETVRSMLVDAGRDLQGQRRQWLRDALAEIGG